MRLTIRAASYRVAPRQRRPRSTLASTTANEMYARHARARANAPTDGSERVTASEAACGREAAGPPCITDV